MKEFVQVIKKMIQEETTVTVVSGTVKEVRENDLDVSRTDMPDLIGVRFHSVVDDELQSGFKVVPKQGSEVLCALIENDKNEAYLLSCSEIETTVVKIGDLLFQCEANGVRITKDGENLKTVFNDFQDAVGELCDKVSAIVVNAGYGVTPDVPGITIVKNKIVQDNKTALNKILIA